ncbi:MAG: amino acid transporter [Pseudohongiellaceae bacterium]|jgi:amino acid transporter
MPALKRTISCPLLTLYGLGTILGAGIYVLIGKVALVSGLYAPLAFVVVAAVTAVRH